MTSYGKTWTTEAQNAADGLFFVKTEFVLAVRTMGNKNFSVVEHRQQAFEIWDKLMPSHPIAKDRQMPDTVTYVAVENCDFAKIETQMLKALSYKESSKHRNEPAKEPVKSGLRAVQEHDHISGVLVNFSPMDDASSAYYEAVRSLKDVASKTECTYDRASFEKKFGLTWA